MSSSRPLPSFPRKQFAKQLRDSEAMRPLLSAAYRGLRRLPFDVPPSLYRHLPFRGVFEVRTRQSSFRLRSHGHVVENGLFWGGLAGHEAMTLRVWEHCAERARLVVDVGANTGVFAFIAAASPGRPEVVAFEPVERMFRALRENAALNPSLDVEARPEGVSHERGTAQLFDPGGDHCYSASLEAEFRPAWASTTEVQIVSLDGFFSERNALENVDLLKIDVEGHEEAVLRGAEALFRTARPTALIEVLPDADEDVFKSLRRIAEEGYLAYRLNDLRRTATQSLDRTSHTDEGRNLLLLPQEKKSELAPLLDGSR